MRIFLSYASEDIKEAEEIALALGAAGHEVFFDRSSLSGGEDYHTVIRDRIADSDRLVFLVTPRSVAEGAYTLTELRMARERWPHPKGHVLPVLLERTEMDRIPAYLRSVTLFQPEGNAAAEISAHLSRKAGGRGRYAAYGAVAAVLLALGFGAYRFAGRHDPSGTRSFVSRIEASQFVSHHVLGSEEVERNEYALDPTSRVGGKGDVVLLDRVAFGEIRRERSAETRRERTSAGIHITVRITNTGREPILLDLSPRFFELGDDRGRKAELLYFCCESKGERLGPGSKRVIELIYRSVPGWQGKETSAGAIRFRISGLLPLVQGVWTFRPLAVAA